MKNSELINRFLKSPQTIQISNEKLLRLFNTFRLDYSDFLPTVKPNHVTKTPFQFHSTYNDNESFITKPRLSVTKLLTNSWCELREYYQIYSGSMKEPKSESLLLGTKYHEELELETFEIINIVEFQRFLQRVFHPEDVANNDLEQSVELQDDTESVPQFIANLDAESELCNEWMESALIRLYNLLVRSETRELLVHGYLDLENLELRYTKDSVLISGVVDYLQLVNTKDPHDLTMFEEIQALIDLEFNQYLDLNNFLLGVEQITSSYSDDYKLKITDVKTRRTNHIPNQLSVLEAAYLQVCYYKQFFDTLSTNPHDTYKYLCHNAEQRNCDLDKPVDPLIIFSLLRKYPDLLLNDFTKLANGETIGFEPYDNHEHKQKGYNFDQAFGVSDFAYLRELDDFDYGSILNEKILTQWKKPLTLRYFAARTAQFYCIFNKFVSNSIAVEYHNARTKFNFKTMEYEFNLQELNKSVQHASRFWNGTAKPQLITDIRKCKYCDFSSKCTVPNKNLQSFGVKLKHFINENVNHHQN